MPDWLNIMNIKEFEKAMKNLCPCCGYLTLPENHPEQCGFICPVCFWEYEGSGYDENTPSGANHGITLVRARANFREYGACTKEMIGFTRPPLENETEIFSENNRRDFDRYLAPFFRSVIEQDRNPIVICNTSDDIVYMNPAAKERYKKHGELTGKSIMDCHNENSQQIILKITDWFEKDPEHNLVYTYHNEKENKDVYMVALRDENKRLIGYYEKHEYRNAETMKKYDLYE